MHYPFKGGVTKRAFGIVFWFFIDCFYFFLNFQSWITWSNTNLTSSCHELHAGKKYFWKRITLKSDDQNSNDNTASIQDGNLSNERLNRMAEEEIVRNDHDIYSTDGIREAKEAAKSVYNVDN